MSELYQILEIPTTASNDEIKRSYRRLVMLYHPDKNGSPEAHVKFLEIQKAYDILSDPDLKSNYDLGRSTTYTTTYYPPTETNDTTSSTSRNNKRAQHKSKKRKGWFDPEEHVPNYTKSYISTDDFDAICMSRIVLRGFAAGIIVMIVSTIMTINLYLLFMPTFLIMAFMMFDLALIIDMKLQTQNFHAYIVNITENKNKRLYSLYMSMSDKPIENISTIKINLPNRYRNYFYTKTLDYDFYTLKHFTVHRSPIFRIILGFVGHASAYNKELKYYNERRKTITNHCFGSLIVGVILLFSQSLSFIYPLSFVYFIYHFLFIRQHITNNRLN